MTGGRDLYTEHQEQVINFGRVTRCVMPRFDPSKGYAGVQRGVSPPTDPQLQAQGFHQTGNRCGPGGFGVEYEGPQTPFIGEPPGMGSTGSYSMPRNIRRELAASRRIRRRNQKVLERAAKRAGLGQDEGETDPYPMLVGGFLALAGAWWLFTKAVSPDQ